jgi:hypothetical protein
MVGVRESRTTADLLMLAVLAVIHSLPGMARLCSSAGLVLVVCRDCGRARFVAGPEARARLLESGGWPAVEQCTFTKEG